MTVGEWLSHIGEYNHVVIYDNSDNSWLAEYDGKNSIDEMYNDYKVIDFAIKGNAVELYV